ncbi:MAG: hypothetical protein RBU37_19495 [Myxococcota bacterium]|jgi:hypothetical protein|nr:hypothetical protein [Myxococcota bacterium]
MPRLLALLALLCCVACSGARPSPEETLSRSLTTFHSHLLFGRYDDAAAYLPLEQREAFLEYYQGTDDDLKITEFEIARSELAPTRDSAKVEVDLSWYQLPSMTVKTSKMVEKWEYDSAFERWTLVEHKVKDD